MIKEAIEKIEQSVLAGIEPKVIPLAGNRTLLVTKEGSRVDDNKYPPRNHTTVDIDSFIAAVNDYGANDCTVWVNTSCAVAVLDDEAYRDSKIVLVLQTSDQVEALRRLPFEGTQRELIRYLKRSFDMEMAFLKAIRKVDFRRTGSGTKTIEHGRESLGKSVEAEVQGADAIPEATTISVPAFKNRRCRAKYAIELRVDIDVENEAFWLGSGPNELDAVEQQAVQDVFQVLDEELTTDRVFIGSPGAPRE